MKRLSTEQHIKEVIAEKLGIPITKITPQKNLVEDFSTDSLDQVELIMAFEDEFDIIIPDEDAEKLKTVNNVIQYIEEKI